MQQTLAVREANFLRADTLYRKNPAPRADTLQFRMAHAVKIKDTRKQQELLAAYRKTTQAEPGGAGYRLLRYLHEPEIATELAAIGLTGDRTPEVKDRNGLWMSMIDIERGRIKAALDRIDKRPKEQRLHTYSRLLGSTFYPIPPERLAAYRAELLKADSLPDGETPAQHLRGHVRLWRLAQLSCRTGAYDAAIQYARRMRALPVAPHWQASIAFLANAAEAQADVGSGRAAEGLRKLESMPGAPAVDMALLFEWGGPAIHTRAEALFRLQRYEEAARWFDILDEAYFDNQPHIAYVILRRAQIHDARNESEQARDHYARFLKLWDNPDPELRSIVEAARARLAALQERRG